ncbi:hypothetical protein [Chloroflexus sp.]|uniref:hypothetical protein n=1 Tax=Chloroflexus sp. TaxID=1904827 RepID=UPI0026279779|nr:hypothetical protein [uncultured Chloroflexus sp.]
MESSHPLHQLADRIEQAGLSVPAALMLQILAPLDVVCSQGAQVLMPLTRGTRLAGLIEPLTTPAHWPALRDLLLLRLQQRR